MRDRIDSPALATMFGRIAEMNQLAEESPGFVWRFRSPCDTSYLEPFRGYFEPFIPERIFFNMSVWRSVESLRDYVYKTRHVEMYRRREEWMEPISKPGLVLWWIEEGEFPTVAEARQRFDQLNTSGPTKKAFTFRKVFSVI